MARTNRGRGGNRPPANPAPVSLPQSGARTDGPATQPVREFEAQRHGQRTALREQQQAAPLQAGPQGAPGGPVGGPPPPDLFRGTERPDEDPSALATNREADMRPSVFPEDPDMLLRVLNNIAPHPDIERLLERYR